MTRLFLLLTLLAGLLRAEPLDLRLPTPNQHLLTGEPEQFYMYVDRTFEGQVTKPWEGGSFGFVRSPIRVGSEVVLTKFHEGIDIAPTQRDAVGNPLDMVTSIADGKVVHTSLVAGQSNYGKYVVVEHPWEGSSVVSVYAHLSEITCHVGDPVKAGSVLGKMGFTGEGIDRTRAHTHLELGFVMSARYEDWHAKFGGGKNLHGLYNGMNVAGCDVAAFFLAHKDKPELKFSEYIASCPVYFKVAVPGHDMPDFVKRYPWLSHGTADAATSWEIAFTATGMPVSFDPSQREVTAPTIVAIRPSTVPHRYLTRNLVTGEGNKVTLTASGKNLVALLTDDFPAAPPAAPAPIPSHEHLR